MPRKKTVIPDDQPVEGLTAQPGGEENEGQFPETGALPDTAPGGEDSGGNAPNAGEGQPDGLPADPLADGDLPGEGAPADGEPPSDAPVGEEPLPGSAPDAPDAFPADGENPFPDLSGGGDNPQPPDGLAPESDDPEYGALLQEWGEAGHGETGAEEPLTLAPARSRTAMCRPLSRLNRRKCQTARRPPRPGVPEGGPAAPRAQPPLPQIPAVTGC